tara:strand:+ start:113 stop:430 length:318 start_codon:yes stop_codon:yes gene_type:complete
MGRKRGVGKLHTEVSVGEVPQFFSPRRIVGLAHVRGCVRKTYKRDVGLAQPEASWQWAEKGKCKKDPRFVRNGGFTRRCGEVQQFFSPRRIVGLTRRRSVRKTYK